jgi:hypothetical protein
MASRIREWLILFKAQMLAEKKKSAILGTLFLILILVLGRALFKGSKPEAAVAVAPAAPLPPPSVDPAQPLVRPETENPAAGPIALPLSAPPSSTVPPPLPNATSVAPKAENASPAVGHAGRTINIDDWPRVLERDPFSSSAWLKPPIMSEEPDAAAGAAERSSESPAPPSILSHLSSVLGQLREERASELTKFDSEIAQLALQSTMTGSVPRAYISGRLVHVGDLVKGFTVSSIKDRRVVVRKYGLSRVLKMP